MARLVRVLVVILVLAAVAGCRFQTGPLRSGVLDQAEAIERAREVAPGTADVVSSVWLGQFGALDLASSAPEVDSGRLIWEVVLTGSFSPVPCPSAAASQARPCPALADRAQVVLDARSGEILSLVLSTQT
jgi:hypothetical protein